MKSIPVLLLLLAPIVSSAEHTSTHKSTRSDATSAAADATPLAVCKQLADSASKNDFESVQKHSMEMRGPGKGSKADANFRKMHQENLGQIQNLNCLAETVSEDRAFVEAEAEGGKRLIPFVKTEAGWKFDAKTYMSFYDYDKKGMHGKGMHEGAKKGKM
ncbi:MAG: hypothetical protein NDI61_07395 [Bdellovibrionaceae bacterium]|nr:hypothetical protein [Pseudobdellovibrionaceae bacterium]